MTYPPQPPQYDPQYGQPPTSGPPGGYAYPPAQPPKKRKKWPWIVGGIVLLSILGCVGVFTLVIGGTAKVASDLDNNQSGKNAVAGEMGKAAKDGKFQFTVTDLKCGLDSVGPADFGQKAQGQFCLVSVTIKNVGTTAEVFSDISQKVLRRQGRRVHVGLGCRGLGEQGLLNVLGVHQPRQHRQGSTRLRRAGEHEADLGGAARVDVHRRREGATEVAAPLDTATPPARSKQGAFAELEIHRSSRMTVMLSGAP